MNIIGNTFCASIGLSQVSGFKALRASFRFQVSGSRNPFKSFKSLTPLNPWFWFHALKRHKVPWNLKRPSVLNL